jgi:osmoprotectant transport system substrate-binding protein
LPSCAAHSSNALRVGSTNSAENTTVAEIYAIALERAGLPVERHMDMGTEPGLLAALLRGDIDLYPAHTPEQKRDGIIRLAPSPAVDGPCLAASQYSAEEYWLLTLSTCSAIAGRLRLAATADFVAAGGPLDRLRDAYGGFEFKRVTICEPGTQYYALNRGDADVASALTTDAAIVETQLVILGDDKHAFPSPRIAPLIRTAAARSHPRAGAVLDRISRALTQYALREMNRRRSLLNLNAHEVAQDFVDAQSRQTAKRRS